MSPADGFIQVRGARQNNLANIDVAIPKGQLTVVTGVSGSGKSSLAFETLYAEGQRRYVESFSTYARQFLERMDRPDVDSIDGLLPAVAMEQRNTIRSARSTLGTLTELTDYLKVLFARLAVLHCPSCQEEVFPDRPGGVVDLLLAKEAGRRLVVTAPFHLGEEADREVALGYLTKEGYQRIWLDGVAADLVALDPASIPSRVDVVCDRAVVRAEDRQRLVESLEAAYRLGSGEAAVHVETDAGTMDRQVVSQDLRHCGLVYPHPREGMFSFSSPLGACPACNGFGRITDFDMDRVVPDRRLSLAEGAIRPWAGKKRGTERRWLRQHCEELGISMDVPWCDLPETGRQVILDGVPGARWRSGWVGVRGWFAWLGRKTYKMHVRILLARYRSYLPCPDCDATRFQPSSLLYRVAKATVADVLKMSVSAASGWLSDLPVDPKDKGLAPVVDQLRQRLRFLERVGLGYLTLDRQGRTLSGGEVQRANLTSALGSGLVNTLFVLDEPTIGLHAQDSARLADLLDELTERENTVVLVEHDPDMLRVADHLVDLGPGPGADGGRVVYAGSPAGLGSHEESATARAIARRARERPVSRRDLGDRPQIVVRGARAHNLRSVDVSLPVGALTVLTGVSGSGKSTLVDDVLYRGIRRRHGLVTDAPGLHDAMDGLEHIEEVIRIDQGGPGQNPRANPATYVKAWDPIRTLFSRQPLARERGYTAGTFSFNTGKGRCPACDGAGFERVEMQFLSDVILTCELCEGRRFTPEVLEVTWQGRSIADMLALTVSEAAELLTSSKAAKRRLGVLEGVGLGYLTLGQSLHTLSGGEAQRLKIAQHLGAARTRRALFLLDEPTSGLHLEDVDLLVDNLRALAAAGNTVLVVEHHLDVIAAGDYVIELGPGGGDAGGEVVFAGSPGELSEATTATGTHLARWIGGIRPLENAPGLRDGPANPGARYLSEASRPAAPNMIEVEGARTHNLKDISLTLPRTGRTVVSGVSGSGKSSLTFDILFAEGQRRFLDCVSPYARQYITQLGRPDADRIAGVPPTVAIEQRTTRGGALSVVANVTEIGPFLRILYARLGEGNITGQASRTARELAAQLQKAHPTTTVRVLAPVVRSRKGFHKPVFVRATSLGYDEVYVDGALRPPKPRPRLKRHRLHSIDLVVAALEKANVGALENAIAEAARLADGRVRVLVGDEVHGPWQLEGGEAAEATKRAQFDPRIFSPHTKVGRCDRCKGTGFEPDEEARCAACHGERLAPAGRQIRFAGRRLPELLALTPPELVSFFADLELGPNAGRIAAGPRAAILERTGFLMDVGLGYLTLDRPVRSLSGGEAQRIRLAAQLGAHLSGVLYVLDEPTIGLHPTDTERLLQTLDRLQERGNGVLMVEHDPDTLRTADVVVDMGPGAGIDGGEILVQGDLAAVMKNRKSITGRMLRRAARPQPLTPRSLDGSSFLVLEGVTHHNIRDANVRFARGRLNVVTGVSGSGKSSLVHDVLARVIDPTQGAGTWKRASGLEGIGRMVRVDDKPIGKNPRSCPATYVGLWDEVRKLFSRLPESRLRGYQASRFSFNVKGGRCEACAGQGEIKLEMSFLPDAFVGCDVCGGRRYSSQTLHVTYDGKSIHDVLELSVRQALAVFENVPRIARALGLLDDVGLGYLKLGQRSPTLSGGESQRIKFISHLLVKSRDDTVIVLDEPSVGLHMADIPKLLNVTHRLVDTGATVVVIEHNADVIRAADWVIDLGPGGGPDGGNVIYQGPYEGLPGAPGSRTGEWLDRFGFDLMLRQAPP